MSIVTLAIEEGKLYDYLLNLNGKDPSKAAYFLGLGFSLLNIDALADALLIHAKDNWPGHTVTNMYGTKHVIIGAMSCPLRVYANVLSVWMIEGSSTRADLVTAYKR